MKWPGLKSSRLKHPGLKSPRLKHPGLKRLGLKNPLSCWRKIFNQLDWKVSDWKSWDWKILDWKILGRVDLKCGGSGGYGGLRRVTFFSPFWKLPQFWVKYECFINSEWPSAFFKIQRVFFCPYFLSLYVRPSAFWIIQWDFFCPYFLSLFCTTLRILKNTEGFLFFFCPKRLYGTVHLLIALSKGI